VNIYADDPALLQLLANDRTLARLCRTAGAIGIFFGLLELANVALLIHAESLEIIRKAAAAGLLLNGALLIWRRVPGALISTGLLLMLTEAIDLVELFQWGVLSLTRGFVLLIAVWLFMLGLSWIISYRQLIRLPQRPATKHDGAALDALVKQLAQTKPTKRPDIVELRTKAVIGEVPWKAQLLPDRVFLISLNARRELLILDKNNFTVEAQSGKGRRIKVRVRLGERLHEGTLTAEALVRYRAWKEHAAPAAPLGVWVPTSYSS
jgi:hypothetical protein